VQSLTVVRAQAQSGLRDASARCREGEAGLTDCAELADWAADEPLIDLLAVAVAGCSSAATDRTDAAEHFPAPAVELECLAGRDLLLDGYLGSSPIGVFERKQRRHPDFIGSVCRERERGASCRRQSHPEPFERRRDVVARADPRSAAFDPTRNSGGGPAASGQKAPSTCCPSTRSFRATSRRTGSDVTLSSSRSACTSAATRTYL
jgi:hypothetical protein